MNGIEQRIQHDLALNLPLQKVQQIEASAGTGKTYTIAGLYARLVVERALPVREILVMTFTKPATEELRRRLRERLALCAHMAAALPDRDEGIEGERAWALALLRRHLQASGESADALAQRLRLASMGMDEAAIFTIHGFCQRVLIEQAAFLSDSTVGVELVPSDLDLLEDFASDAWLRLGASTDGEARDVLRLLGDSPQALAQSLKDLVGFGGLVEPQASAPDSAATSLADAQTALCRAWMEHGEAAQAALAEWFGQGFFKGNIVKDGCVEQLAALTAKLRDGIVPSAQELGRFGQAKLAGAVTKGSPDFPGQPAFQAIDRWLAYGEVHTQRLRQGAAHALGELVLRSRAWLRERKRVLARLSYDDQVSRVREALRRDGAGARLAEALHRQYPVALVDEFQDTDARQLDILEVVYAARGTLFCIGDPKQAIYGFRGGDIQAYLRVGAMAEGLFSLKRNFRSAPGMLRATEAVFTAQPHVFAEPGIEFEPVAWGGRCPDRAVQFDGEPLPALTLWQAPPEPRSKAQLQDECMQACADEVARLLMPGATQIEGKALTPGQVAVLVNSNDQASRMQDALTRRGVASACVRRESVYASLEALELRALLEALLVPQDLMRARGALATTLLGYSLRDLDAMREHEARWREALGELERLRTSWFERGVLAMLERLGQGHAARLLALPQGERRMTNLMQLGEALQEKARQLAGARAQCDWLAARIAEADANNEDEQLRLESDAERVQIVTLHRAKGLEYDLVFMPFAATHEVKAPAKGQLARFHRGDELVQRLILTDSTDRKGELDPLAAADADALAAAEREALAEAVRLLYVGITRARHACWISVNTAPRSRGGARPEARVLWHVLGDGERLQALAAAHTRDIRLLALPEAAARRVPAMSVPAQGEARVFTRTLDRDWRVHSFSRLAEGGHEEGAGYAADESVAPELPAGDAAVLDVPDWPRGPRFGNAVHNALEQVDFAAWRGPLAAPWPRGQVPVIRQALADQGYAGDELGRAVDATARMVAAALRAPVLESVCLADIAPHARRAEMEFHFGMERADPAAWLALMKQHGYQAQRHDFVRLGNALRGLMTGFIDLVFVHAGRWWVVDYKTNHLGPRRDDYAPERLPAALAHHDYDLQYLIYTLALHRWLKQVRGPAYDYARDFGGVRYLFVRGMDAAGRGVFADRPPQALIEAMDALLAAPGLPQVETA